MSRKRTFFYGALLFLSGAVFGAVCLHLAFRFHLMHGFEHRRGDIVPVVMKKLDAELDLTDTQRDAIRPVVEDMQKKMMELRQETKPRIEGILDDAVSKAEPVLNDDQKAKLHELESRIKEHFDRK